jgi:N-acetylglucosaminyldiphosphoundecaprenol N-acetyl-beta-D-mannosaminyltransferase
MASMATNGSGVGSGSSAGQGPASASGGAAGEARSWRVTQVLGVPVAVSANVFAAALELKQRGGGQIVTLNAEMTMAARANPELGAAIAAAELVIPDGAGVVWALARQGYRVRRSPGIELARALLEYGARHGWRVALVGASPEVMASLRERLVAEIPGLDLVLTLHGYQDPALWPGLEAELRGLRPDLVLAALGVPRQETWIQRLHQGQPGLWMGVGGSFDVWAGSKQRAPAWMGRLQIEWLYRLIQEPSRWRRMLALPAFAWEVLRRG